MKNVVIAIVVVAVIGIIGYMVVSQNSETDVMMEDESSESMMKNDKMMDDNSSDSMMEDKSSDSMMESDKMMADSRYVEHTDGILDSTSGRRVLFFYASWCPTCRPSDADFKANMDSIPDDVTVIRVNYDDSDTDASEEALAKEYGVTYQHTFVQIDENGDKVASWNGGQLDELLANIK